MPGCGSASCSGVLASDPANADRVISAIGTLPAEDQWIVARAIAWSGLPDWRDVMRRACWHAFRHAK